MLTFYGNRQMTAQDYGVRVVRAYSNMTVGRIIWPPGVLRDRLVATGFVERVQPPAKTEPVSAVAQPLAQTSEATVATDDAGKIEFRRRGRG